MKLNEGDVIIVIKPNGLVAYWAQDTPEILEYLSNVEELSTCACERDHCPVDEMVDRWECTVCGAIVALGQACAEHTSTRPAYVKGWRQQLADGMY